MITFSDTFLFLDASEPEPALVAALELALSYLLSPLPSDMSPIEVADNQDQVARLQAEANETMTVDGVPSK